MTEDGLVERLGARIALHFKQEFGAALEIEAQADRHLAVDRLERQTAGEQTGHDRADTGGAARGGVFSREVPDEKADEAE